MKLILGMTVLLVASVGCASKSTTPDSEVNAQFAKAKSVALKQSNSPESKEFIGVMTAFWQKMLTSPANRCTGTGISLVLTVDKQGMVQDAVGSPWNRTSKCYAKLVMGKQISPPPEHPFFSVMELN